MASTPSLSLKNLLCLDLYAASRAVIKAYGPLLKDLGLTYPQYLVMVCLWESGGVSVKELCERLSLDSGTLSPLLKRLESAGLVERSRSRVDERGVDITLTRAGKELQPKAGCVVKTMACRLGMSPEAARKLQEQLRDITRRFEEDAESSD